MIIVNILDFFFIKFYFSFSDLKHTNSVFPLNQITYLPCDCDAGYGLINDNDTNITCVKCKPGQFSSGGEILSDFKNWNESSGVPGLVYRAYSYCSDFLSGKQCKSWSVGGILLILLNLHILCYN